MEPRSRVQECSSHLGLAGRWSVARSWSLHAGVMMRILAERYTAVPGAIADTRALNVHDKTLWRNTSWTLVTSAESCIHAVTNDDDDDATVSSDTKLHSCVMHAWNVATSQVVRRRRQVWCSSVCSRLASAAASFCSALCGSSSASSRAELAWLGVGVWSGSELGRGLRG